MVNIIEKTNKKIVFHVVDEAKKVDVKLMVKTPDNAEAKELQKVYDVAMREAMDSGGIMNAEVEKVARKMGVWDDEKTNKVQDIHKKMRDIEYGLAQGKKSGWTKAEAKDKALEMVDLRAELRSLLSSTDAMYADTCEARATNARFNRLVFLCSKDPETNKKYFKNYQDYEDELSAGSEVVAAAITYMGCLDRGLDPEFWNTLPETKFLMKYGYVNDKGLFQNSKGELVNKQGKRVDSDGRLINDKGELIDSEGRIIDKDGNFLLESEDYE